MIEDLRTAEIGNFRGSKRTRKHIWDQFVSTHTIFKGIDSFLVFQLWKKKVKLPVRRRIKQLDCVPYVALPSYAKANASVKSRFFGQWDVDSGFIAGGEPATVAQKLGEGMLPIGKIITTVTQGNRKYLGRQIEVCVGLYSLTVNAVKHGLIKPEVVRFSFSESFFFVPYACSCFSWQQENPSSYALVYLVMGYQRLATQSM
jgi:hypothetical protein